MKTIKYITLMLFSCFAILFLTIPKTYAFFDGVSDTYTQNFTITYSPPSMLVNIDGVNFNYYIYKLHITDTYGTWGGKTLFFTDEVFEDFLHYWAVFTDQSEYDFVFFTYLFSNDANDIDDNILSFHYLHNFCYLHVLSLVDNATVSNQLNKLKLFQGHAGEFIKVQPAQGNYIAGYNDAISNKENWELIAYNNGYIAGYNDSGIEVSSIVNFVPKILGSAWAFIYTILVWEVPFINISLAQILSISLGLGIIVWLFRAVFR